MSTPQERIQRYNRLRGRLPRLLSQGDSWFDYPLFANLIDRIDERERYAIRRLEHSGDRLSQMVASPRFDDWAAEVRNEAPQAVLLSAGGNDLALVATSLFLPFDPRRPIGEHLDPVAWAALENQLRHDLLMVIGRIGMMAPVLVHGYDRMHPSPAEVHILGMPGPGPWVWPALMAAGITDPRDQAVLGGLMVDRFNEMLADLAAQHPLDLIHVDLRGAIEPGREWQNEIHPTRGGFRKVAKEFLDQMDAKLPAVLRARQAHNGGGL